MVLSGTDERLWFVAEIRSLTPEYRNRTSRLQ